MVEIKEKREECEKHGEKVRRRVGTAQKGEGGRARKNKK